MEKKMIMEERVKEDKNFWDDYKKSHKIPIFATYEERRIMAYANPLIMNHLKDFINSLKRLDHIRVLEVAMG